MIPRWTHPEKDFARPAQGNAEKVSSTGTVRVLIRSAAHGELDELSRTFK